MIVPKSYKVRHEVLQFLSDKRSEQLFQKLPIEKAMYTIDEISKETGFDRRVIDQQLNVLWKKEEIVNQPNNLDPADLTLTKYLILSKGISTASSKTILNDGKIINSQLFNNYASGLFQIIVGIIAIFTLYQSMATIDAIKLENNKIQSQINSITKESSNLKNEIKILRNTQTIRKIDK